MVTQLLGIPRYVRQLQIGKLVGWTDELPRLQAVCSSRLRPRTRDHPLLKEQLPAPQEDLHVILLPPSCLRYEFHILPGHPRPFNVRKGMAFPCTTDPRSLSSYV